MIEIWSIRDNVLLSFDIWRKRYRLRGEEMRAERREL